MDNLLDQLDNTKPTSRQFDKTVSTASATAVKAAVGSKGATEKRKTIYLAPEVQEYIQQTADDLGIGVMACYRFLLVLGLEAVQNGRRPEVVSVSSRLTTDDWRP
jgi:hypothetical protein